MPPSPDRRLLPSTLGLSASDWSVAAMVLIVKAAVLVFGLFSFEITNGEPIGSFAHMLSIWNRWDGPQYVLIAQRGYGATGNQRLALVFFPLYPWLIRTTALVLGDAVASAFLISAIASVVAGVALARLFALDYPPRLARSAVWFLFIFPTSYFLHADYSESLFLALVATSFLAARRADWMEAGGLGALAAMARPNGILLLPALGAEALGEWWRTRRLELRWLWIGAVALGLGVHMLVNYRVTGDALAFLRLEHAHWSNQLVAPWRGVAVNLGIARTYNPHDAAMIGMQVLFYLAVGLAGTVAAAMILRRSYAVWMALNWLVIASQNWDISAPRYTLVMFPLFILIAMLARKRSWNIAITVWSLLWLAMFTSEFVRAHWAF
jgi:hypothetical protein